LVNIADAGLKSFASKGVEHSAEPQPSSGSLFILTSTQLQDIIIQANQEAIKPLEKRLDDALKKISELETQQDRDFDEIASKINEHSEAINRVWKAVKIRPPPTPGEKTEQRLKMLDSILLGSSGPVSFSEIGKKLELGSRDSKSGKTTRRQAMTKLGELLDEMPDRYIIHKAKRGNAKFVSLVPAYAKHLRMKRKV
jgi:hypothetical protein